MKRSVDVYMAAMYRSRHVLHAVRTLWRNPEVATVTVVLNKCDDRQYNELSSELKLMGCTVYRGDNSKGCSHKIQYIAEGTSQYVSLCDDDILYPKDFFKVLIEKCEQYQGAVGLGGRILKPAIVKSYYREKQKGFKALLDVDSDQQADILATSSILFKREWFDDMDTWFDFVERPNMTDLYLGYIMKERGVKKYIIAHKAGWLRHKEKEEGDDYIYDAHRNSCKAETDFVNNVWKPYLTSSIPS